MGRTTGGVEDTSQTPDDPFGVGGFEGVCLNSRHPDHGRVWEVGPGARLLTPLPRDPRGSGGIRGDPRATS